MRRLERHLLLLAILCLGTVDVSMAGGGWYLLTPPVSDYNPKANYLEGFKVVDSTRLSQWIHQGSFDTATACEDVRSTRVATQHNFFVSSHEAYLKALVNRASAPELDHMR